MKKPQRRDKFSKNIYAGTLADIAFPIEHRKKMQLKVILCKI